METTSSWNMHYADQIRSYQQIRLDWSVYKRKAEAVLHIRDEDQELEIWRDGVETRMYASSRTGASQLTIFEQWCAPGHGAPLHVHAVEEVLRVLAGAAEFTVGNEHQTVHAGESIIVSAGIPHGFVNTGTDTLHTQAILAAPIFEVHYLESNQDARRWHPVSDSR